MGFVRSAGWLVRSIGLVAHKQWIGGPQTKGREGFVRRRRPRATCGAAAAGPPRTVSSPRPALATPAATPKLTPPASALALPRPRRLAALLLPLHLHWFGTGVVSANPSHWCLVCIVGGSSIQSNICTLMEALVSCLNSMVMEASQTPEYDIQQKPGPDINQNPVENDLKPEEETDEDPGSKVNQEPLETCQVTVVETDKIPEKQAVPEAGLEVKQKAAETCQETATESDVNPEKQTSDPGIIYRCKKCRRMLATQEFVVTHEVGAGGKSFKGAKKFNIDEDDQKPECPCIFVEPMKWMQTVEEGYVANKLFCMGCKARLGQFNWAGMQCSCGAWVIPAFQLTKSKIDECSM